MISDFDIVGIFISQFYVLNKMSIIFFEQFHQQTVDRLDQPALIHCQLKHFAHLYMMVQHLKVYMKRLYMSMAVSASGTAICLYYLVIYSDLFLPFRLILFWSLTVLVTLVNFFSYFSGLV